MITAIRKHAFGEPAPKKKPRKYAESDAQKRVVKWLRERTDWMVLRLENAARRTPPQAARDKAMGMNPGAPDLVLFYKQHLLFLEMKSTNGETSQEQRNCHAELRMRKAGMLVGYGFDDAISKLQEFADMCDKQDNAAQSFSL